MQFPVCAIFLASLFWSFLCLHVTPRIVFDFIFTLVWFMSACYPQRLPSNCHRLPTNCHRLPTNRHRLPTKRHRRAYWTL